MNPRALTQPVLALAAIACAAFAQYQHTFHHSTLIALAGFATAIGIWLVAIILARVDIRTRIDETQPGKPHSKPASRALVISAIVLTALTFLFAGGNEFNGDNVFAWLLSIGVFVYAFWEPEKSGMEWDMRLSKKIQTIRQMFSDGIYISPRGLMLGAIMLIGIFFYYHNLDGVPAEMDSDHAEKLLDVNDIVTNNLRPIFFERNTGREPLQFYLTAAFIELTGHPIDHMALKLITALMGVLVIPFTFLFARELFDDDVAMLAALFIAFSKWPLTIARMGLRFPLTPVFIAPLMYFLFRAFKYHRRNDFLIAGLILGIGLNGYNAFRIAPILVALFAGVWLIISQKNAHADWRRYLANIFLLFMIALIVLMPFARYLAENPGNVFYRMATRLTGVEQPVSENPLSILASNLIRASLMFNWIGDEAWPNAIPDDPALDYVAGALFLLGIVYAIYRLARYREMAYAFVLIGLGTMLLPSALSIAFPNENPSVVRAGGAIPFVFIVVALPLAWLARAMKDTMLGRVGALTLITLIILASIHANFTRYFIDFDEHYRARSWNSSEVAVAIRAFSGVVDLNHTWILLYPHWIDTRNVAINLHAIGWEQTLPQADDARAHVDDPANKLYVLNFGDEKNLVVLQQIFPNGKTQIVRSRTPGHDFRLFYVPSQ